MCFRRSTSFVSRFSRVRSASSDFNDMKRVDKQTALVTGGATGIGAACVRKLLDEGASVLLVDRDEQALENAHTAFGANTDSLRIAGLDMADESQRRIAIERAIEWRGTCDILINNAAAFVMKGTEADSSDWHTIL